MKILNKIRKFNKTSEISITFKWLGSKKEITKWQDALGSLNC